MPDPLDELVPEKEGVIFDHNLILGFREGAESVAVNGQVLESVEMPTGSLPARRLVVRRILAVFLGP